MKEVPLSDSRTGSVMVVDDEEHNRELLREILVAEGHRVTEAQNGEEAIAGVREMMPDVILLDVMMPRMTGFEACQLLKADPTTAHIPILMVTSLADREARLLGIEAGANDFLPKPIDRQDVVLRVRNAVFTTRLFQQLQQSYERLQQLEALRDNLTHMIIHDLRSPLTGILGCLQLLEMKAGERLTGEELTFLRNASGSTTTLTELISSILDVSRLESGEMPLDITQCNLAQVASNAIKHLESRAHLKRIQLDVGSQQILVHCDQTIVGRIIANLVGNAIKFTPEGGLVRIDFEHHAHQVKIIVTDTGDGIPAEYQPHVFDKFSQVKARRENHMYSTGLGLTFCKLAVESHGGIIGVESDIGRGSRFWFILPQKMAS